MTGVGALSSLLLLAVPVVVVVLVARAVAGRREGRPGEGHGVRRFFQYLLLLGLLVVTLVGATTLLDLAVRPDALVDGGDALARGLTFTVVGGGLFALLVVWTRSLARSDPGELRSIGWTVYLTVAGLVTAAVTAAEVGAAVGAAVTGGTPLAVPLVGTVVWGLAWAVHWRLVTRTLDPARSLALVVVGSLGGWVVGLIGLAAVLAQTLRLLLAPPAILGGTGSGLGLPAGLLAAGAVLWVPHWLRRLARSTPNPVWHGYVLVVGVGLSLVVTLAGLSVALDRGLVWLLGDPGGATPRDYLLDTTVPVAVAAIGLLSWWYHRTVHAARAEHARSEVARIHEYLLSGVALLAAATGVALVVVALVDAAAPPPFAGGAVVNSVLAAVTLLVVGGPLWWLFWARVRRARAADPVAEVGSPTRRAYLVLLFGVAGVVAVVAVLVAVFVVLEDLIGGTAGDGTLRGVRVALGVLVAAGAISGYHSLVQREDRGVTPAVARRGPGLVLLVGPRDDALAAAVHRASGARVDGWPADGPSWDHDQVLAAVGATGGARLLLISEPAGLRVVGSVPDAAPGAGPAAAPAPDRAPDLGSGADAEQRRDQPGTGGQ